MLNTKNKKARSNAGLDFVYRVQVNTGRDYSHSIVAGGLPLMSYTTREMPFTSLMMRLDTRPRKSYGRCAQCAVMKSMVSTARRETTQSYLRPSPITPTERTGRNTVNAWLTLLYRSALCSSSMKIASARRSRSQYSFFTSPSTRTPRPGPGNG